MYTRLAAVEDRHTEIWARLLREQGERAEAPRPSAKARLMAWAARRFGPGVLASLLLWEEGREVKGYLALHRTSEPGGAKDAALLLAKESAEHAGTLRDLALRQRSGLSAAEALAGAKGEPWHLAGSGGFLRNVVYGFNDGLTANFGLVAGVIGAGVEPHVVVVSGVAGMIADSLSMGSSGYLAAKSEAEVYAHEIDNASCRRTRRCKNASLCMSRSDPSGWFTPLF